MSAQRITRSAPFVRPAAFVVAALAIAAAILWARPTATPGPFLRDFEAYWSAGQTADRGANPYGRAIWRSERTVPGVGAQRDEVLPFVSPPTLLAPMRWLGRVPYRLAAPLWYGLLVAALAALVWLVVAGSAPHRTPRRVAFLGLALLAIAFGPVTSALALGQAVPLALLGATLIAATSDRFAWGCAGTLLASFQPNVALGALAFLGRNRTTAAMLVGAGLVYALGAALRGFAWPLAYARLLLAHSAAEACSAIQISPAAIACGFGASPALAHAIALLAALAAVAGALALARQVADRFARFAAFGALAPFAAGFVHEHDLAVAFIAAGWLALRARGIARTIAVVGTLLVAIDWLGLAQRPSGTLQSALLALAALAAFIAADPARAGWRTSALAGAPVALLFGAAALLAATHPLPVWPDALGAFHAPPDASIATVWRAEGRATGLFARQALWAALRALPLAGCALLALAIARAARADALRYRRS